jgi:lipid-binding SYLF domain-containing protein
VSANIRFLFTTALFLASCTLQAALWDKKDADDERQELQNARSEALAKLYREKPEARREIDASKGYAVFSNFGMNLFVVSTARGGGILRDNRSGEDIYMKMFSAGGGWGMGVKDFAAIFIFETDAALSQFRTSGWDFSGQADANLESDGQGEGMETAYTAMPGTTIYQLTDAGVAAQVTLQGTKFWPDEELN